MIGKVLTASFLTLSLIFFTIEVIQVFNKPHTPQKTNKGKLASAAPTLRIKEPETSTIPTITIAPTKDLTPTPTTKALPTTKLTPTPTKISTTIKLIPLGDSITYGSGAIGGYRTDLWKKLVQTEGGKIDFVGSLYGGPADLVDGNHEGHIGWTINDLNVYARNWMMLYQPDIVLLHIGTNDLLQGVSAESMTQRLSQLIGNIFAAKPDTYVIVSTLIVSAHGDKATWIAYNVSIPRVVAQYQSQGRKIVSLDMSQTLSESDLVDGIHPNATGNSKMANMWYPVVTTVYKEYTMYH